MSALQALNPLELRKLVVRARNSAADLGSQDAAFNQLVAAIQDFAVGSAYSYLNDAGLAEDAAQESFIIGWRQLHQLREPTVFLAWFKQIIASQCHRVLRKRSNRHAQLTEGAAYSPDDMEALVSRRESAKLVREAVNQLPPAERLAIVLFYFSGRSQAGIARFLGVPQTTVVKRLASARRRLKTALAPFQTTIERVRPSRNRQFAAMVRAGIYSDYVGLYRYDRRPDLTVRVERIGNRLVSFSAGQKNRVQLGAGLSELRAQEFDGRARFVRNRSGRVTHFVYYEFGRRMGIARKTQ